MTNPPPEEPSTAHSRYGLWLFLLYVLFYAGFMGLSAFAPHAMGEPILLGVNLAIVYGVGLIALALLLALVYMYLCRPSRDNKLASGGDR